MRALPVEARAKNLSGKDFCRYCDNEGYVTTQHRPAGRSLNGPTPSPDAAFEELAPCPFCEYGVKIEFQEGSPWGKDGFWQGREVQDIQPHNSSQGWKPLPASLSRSKLAELGSVIGMPVARDADGAVQPSPSATHSESPAASTETSSSPGGFGETPE